MLWEIQKAVHYGRSSSRVCCEPNKCEAAFLPIICTCCLWQVEMYLILAVRNSIEQLTRLLYLPILHDRTNKHTRLIQMNDEKLLFSVSVRYNSAHIYFLLNNFIVFLRGANNTTKPHQHIQQRRRCYNSVQIKLNFVINVWWKIWIENSERDDWKKQKWTYYYLTRRFFTFWFGWLWCCPMNFDRHLVRMELEMWFFNSTSLGFIEESKP